VVETFPLYITAAKKAETANLALQANAEKEKTGQGA
jgi:hypothetical protein